MAVQDTGICFDGSTNGIGVTVPVRGPNSVWTDTTWPSWLRPAGSQQQPMFGPSRGEWIAEVTLPTWAPSIEAGHLTALSAGKGSPSKTTPLILALTPPSFIRRYAPIEMHSSGARASRAT